MCAYNSDYVRVNNEMCIYIAALRGVIELLWSSVHESELFAFGSDLNHKTPSHGTNLLEARVAYLIYNTRYIHAG
jgi:hypothetical protein